MTDQSFTIEALSNTLARAVGAAPARAAVLKAIAQLKLSGSVFSRESALEILDFVASESGLVGVTARFARSRMLLAG